MLLFFFSSSFICYLEILIFKEIKKLSMYREIKIRLNPDLLNALKVDFGNRNIVKLKKDVRYAVTVACFFSFMYFSNVTFSVA